jgi:hypothetical protein
MIRSPWAGKKGTDGRPARRPTWVTAVRCAYTSKYSFIS